MRKLKLDVEALMVESFQTEKAGAELGTVFGNNKISAHGNCASHASCLHPCGPPPSVGLSCAQQSCGGSCFITDCPSEVQVCPFTTDPQKTCFTCPADTGR